MKKYIKLSLIFMLIINLGIMVSCQKENSYNASKSYSGNINIVTDKFHKAQLEFVAEQFEKSQKNVVINIKIDKDLKNDFGKLIRDKDNINDVISVDNENTQYTIDKYKNDILDLTELSSNYRDNLVLNSLYNTTYNGKVYAMPWDVLPRLIVYRKDIFKKNGISISDIKTWQDYIQVGNKLYKNTGKNFTGNNSEDNDLNLILSNQLGTSYFNYNKKLDFESPKWSRVFNLEKNIYSQNTIVNFKSESDIIDSARCGNILAFIATPYSVRDLMKVMPNDKDMWGVMNLPSFEPGGNTNVSIGGMNLVVNNNSKNSELALAFIKFALTNDEVQLELLNNFGRIPVYKNAYYFKNVNKNVKYFDDAVWSSFINCQQGSLNIEYSKNFPDVKNKLAVILNSYNIKNKDVKILIYSIGKNLEKSQ